MSAPDAGRPSTRRIGIVRHAAALAAAALGASALLGPYGVEGLHLQLGLIGACYALALAISLVPRPGVLAIALFATAAGALNAGTAELARLVGPAPRLCGVPVAVTAPALAGAVAYALLLRLTWLRYLGVREGAMLALASTLATAIAGHYAASLGAWLLALSLAWWLTFSTILCYFDRQPHGAPR